MPYKDSPPSSALNEKYSTIVYFTWTTSELNFKLIVLTRIQKNCIQTATLKCEIPKHGCAKTL